MKISTKMGIIALSLLIIGSVVVSVMVFATRARILRDAIPAELAGYFQEQMIERGVEQIGATPIEGFDSPLLLSAFPGLVEEDFHRVQAYEGMYVFANGQLVFPDTREKIVSTVGRTISEEGYVSLLENVSHRLNVPVEDQASVDVLVDMLVSPQSK